MPLKIYLILYFFIFAIRMMKFFACILSVYVLTLTIIPCVDVCQNKYIQNVELSKSASDSQHPNADQCSPFCTCTCCTLSIVFQDCSIQFSCLPIYKEHQTAYKSSYISSLHSSIWQPPKIG